MADSGKAISPKRFRSALEKGTVGGVVLLVGEQGLVERAVDDAFDALVDARERELAVAAYHADDIDERGLIAELRTPPLFTDRRIVLLRRADKFELDDKRSPLAEYIERPVDTSLLLMAASEIDRRKRLYKLVLKSGTVVDCKKLDRRTGPQFVAAEAAEAGKRIDRTAVDALIELVGADAAMLANEIRNLVHYVGDRESITEDDVMMMTASLREESIFTLTDAIADRDVGVALAALDQLFSDGAEPVYVLVMIEWLLRRLYSARFAVDKGTSPEKAAETVGVPPYFRRKFAAQVNRFTLPELVHLLDLLLDTDIELRQTGRRPKVAMELFVARTAGNQRTRSLR